MTVTVENIVAFAAMAQTARHLRWDDLPEDADITAEQPPAWDSDLDADEDDDRPGDPAGRSITDGLKHGLRPLTAG